MTNLKVGIYLPSFGYSKDGIDHAERLRQWCIRAEELGFDSIWVTDHMLRARNMYAYTWIEPLTTLAFAAAVTKKVTLGTGVLLLPLRHPVLLAKTLSSLQQMSNDRFILGAGTGWAKTVLFNAVQSLRVASILLKPFIPRSAETIYKSFNFPTPWEQVTYADAAELKPQAEDLRVTAELVDGKVKPLFPRIG